MRHTWSNFYTSIKIHCVIFVVDGAEKDPERIYLAKELLQTLMNEDELRLSAFAVIINQKKKGGNNKVYDDRSQDQLHYKLGLHELHESCDWRVQKFVINCLDLDGPSDVHWVPVR